VFAQKERTLEVLMLQFMQQTTNFSVKHVYTSKNIMSG